MSDYEKYNTGFFADRFNRMLELIEQNQVLPVRTGWEQTPQGLVPPPSTRGFGFSSRTAEYWGLKTEIDDEGEVQVSINNPGKVKRTTAYDDSGLVEVVNIAETFTPAEGKFLCLVVEPDLTVTLEMVEQWSGYPYPVKETNSTPAGKKILYKYYYVIWAFVSAPDPDDPEAPPRPIGSMNVSDTIMAVKWGYGTHLQFVLAQDQTATGHVVPYYQLVPGTGTEEPGA